MSPLEADNHLSVRRRLLINVESVDRSGDICSSFTPLPPHPPASECRGAGRGAGKALGRGGTSNKGGQRGFKVKSGEKVWWLAGSVNPRRVSLVILGRALGGDRRPPCYVRPTGCLVVPRWACGGVGTMAVWRWHYILECHVVSLCAGIEGVGGRGCVLLLAHLVGCPCW